MGSNDESSSRGGFFCYGWKNLISTKISYFPLWISTEPEAPVSDLLVWEYRLIQCLLEGPASTIRNTAKNNATRNSSRRKTWSNIISVVDITWQDVVVTTSSGRKNNWRCKHKETLIDLVEFLQIQTMCVKDGWFEVRMSSTRSIRR